MAYGFRDAQASSTVAQVLHTGDTPMLSIFLDFLLSRLMCCAIQIKSADLIAKKYTTRAGAAGADYQAGVQNPRTDWAQATEQSSNAWAAGVQQAASNGSFSKGVTKAGTPKWQRKAAGVGASRYPAGVQAATQDYQNGIAPYLQVLSGLQLPPRGPKGDPGNINRVSAVAAALRSKKLNG